MAYNIYIIACELQNGEDICYGVAHSNKNKIQWHYNFDTDELTLNNSLAPAEFRDILLAYLDDEMDNMDEGKYEYSDERLEEALNLLNRFDLKNYSYRGRT